MRRRFFDRTYFVIRAPRRCSDCGKRFHAPTSWVLCGLTFVGAVAFGVLALIDWIVPLGLALSRADWSAGDVINAALGFVGLLGAVGIAVVAVRTWQYAAWYTYAIGHIGEEVPAPPSVVW
jgi:hypothetical protein